MEQLISKNVLSFGEFEADLTVGELRKNGAVLHLQDQPFQVLKALLERPGELVSREQLRTIVWSQNTYVDFDHALNTAVKKIRYALDDDALAPRFVQTIPRKGYRFIGAVGRKELRAPGEKIRILPNIARRAGLSGAIVVLACALFAGWGISAKDHHPSARRTTLMVLPIENLTGYPSLDRVTDELTDETISNLSALNPDKIGVTARTTSMRYRNSSKTAAEIGRELQVDYIIEGCLRTDGDRVKITSRIVRTSDQSYVWVERFDQAEDDGDAKAVAASAITDKVRALLPRN